MIEQKSLSYADTLQKLRPDCLIHEDYWRSGPNKKDRDEVVSILAEYGGKLVEIASPPAKEKKKL